MLEFRGPCQTLGDIWRPLLGHIGPSSLVSCPKAMRLPEVCGRAVRDQEARLPLESGWS